MLFICSPSDQGVIRNGGRLGARWAPKAIMTQLKKMASHNNRLKIAVTEVSSQDEEVADFNEAQSQEEVRLSQLLPTSKTVVHIGGGHDHILPLLHALGTNRPIVVINIDAHCDTRAESESHSGNPFRLFSQISKYPFKLFQIGIHLLSNSSSTLTDLEKGEMKILFRDQCEDKNVVDSFLSDAFESLPKNGIVVLSLDCDAIDSSQMQAVSAQNHNGLSMSFVRSIFDSYANWCSKNEQNQLIGIYEFNPLYDNISSSNAKVIAGLIYESLKF